MVNRAIKHGLAITCVVAATAMGYGISSASAPSEMAALVDQIDCGSGTKYLETRTYAADSVAPEGTPSEAVDRFLGSEKRDPAVSWLDELDGSDVRGADVRASQALFTSKDGAPASAAFLVEKVEGVWEVTQNAGCAPQTETAK